MKMKNLLLLLAVFLIFQQSPAQQIYNDFEGNSVASFGYYSGVLDSMAPNPDVMFINQSATVAKYVRAKVDYDNIKIYPNSKLVDVTPWASNVIVAPKIKMKLYTNAPVGTSILLQLGARNDNLYPSGIHSEYLSMTTTQNGWQDLEFNFWQMPTGGMIDPNQVDKIVLLFNPGINSNYTFYFDNLTGPDLFIAGMNKQEVGLLPQFELLQNFPNPAVRNTTISFKLNAPGYVSLKIYDMVGNPVYTIVEKNLAADNYSFPVDVAVIPEGVYFYRLKKGSASQTMRMVITK
jgi:hypothetical protein